jgi:transglycosylase-like protein with SLT domain
VIGGLRRLASRGLAARRQRRGRRHGRRHGRGHGGGGCLGGLLRRVALAPLALGVLVFGAFFVSLAGTPPSGRAARPAVAGTSVRWESEACAGLDAAEQRVCDFGPMFNLAGEEHDVDPRLLAAVAWQESDHFAPDVIACERASPDGALGLMQFLPATAAERGVDPCDTADAIFGAAGYLRELHEQFDEDWEVALAAYNAGPNGEVARCRCVPTNGETELYVPAVMDKWAEYQALFPGGVAGCPQAAPTGSTEHVTDDHNTAATNAMANAVVDCFGRAGHPIYCYDPRDDTFEHPRGRACDLMLDDRSRGDEIAAWVQANAEELHVLYVIWWQRYWDPRMGEIPWEEWDPYTGPNPHTDHVHVSIELVPGDPGWAECPHDTCTETWD